MYETYFMNFAKCKTNNKIDFFADDYSGSYRAVKFCSDCIVKNACLNYAIENEIYHGIWGGTSQRTRKTMIRNYIKSGGITNREKYTRYAG